MIQPRTKAGEDEREALYNERLVGPVGMIQLPTESITSLHAILFDFDPKLYMPDNPLFPPSDDPEVFFGNIRPVLDRHPLVRHAEVRMSGSGLHALLLLDPAVELHSSADQQHWAGIVRAVQCTLPIDPDSPGITALTRPVGGVNRKNGATVVALKQGVPVARQGVLDYLAGVAGAPFRGVAVPLLGGDRISPCSVCRADGTRLDVLAHHGKCYGGCSKVTLADVFDAIFLPRIEKPAQAKKGRSKKTKV